MEPAAMGKAGQDWEAAGQSLARQQKNGTLEIPPAFSEIKRFAVFNEIDKQLFVVSQAAAALIGTQACPIATIPNTVPRKVHEIAVPNDNERRVAHELRSERGLRLVIVIGAALAALGLGWLGGSSLYRFVDHSWGELTRRAAVNAVVERIIRVESNGDPNAKNKRSSATGLGQFLNETWLDMIRADRPDLTRERSESETLDLRRDPKIAREIITRFAERNAAMLRQRRLPVTAGTVYLAHFSGSAGAIAILLAPDNADAALVMAKADATGRTTREKIVNANPFLDRFTVADLKLWADRKMRGPGVSVGEIFSQSLPAKLLNWINQM
jgi:hypothetical protein